MLKTFSVKTPKLYLLHILWSIRILFEQTSYWESTRANGSVLRNLTTSLSTVFRRIDVKLIGLKSLAYFYQALVRRLL
jgi:hypothetical protein